MAFNKLKQALISPPVLRLPNFSQQFVVECDVCGDGLGAILSQNNQQIAYYSEALKGKSTLPSTYDNEMLAVVKAVRKWRSYLLGRSFVIKTDHRSLKYLLEQRLTTPSQARWLPKIMGFDYTIQYRKGKENQGADALSRVAAFQFHALSLPIADWWKTLQQEVLQQPYYNCLLTNQSLNCVQRDGIWMQSGRVLLSPTSSLLPVVLADGHSSPSGGHFGYLKTLTRISAGFVWPGIRTSVKCFIWDYEVCQRCKHETLRPAGLLQPLPIPQHIWTDISMDFVEGLPLSQGYNVIMVVVDRLSKYAHFVPLKHPYTAVSVAKCFLNNVVKLHGMPL